jgi:hypothetical protein
MAWRDTAAWVFCQAHSYATRNTGIRVLNMAMIAPNAAESSFLEILRGQLALARKQNTTVQLTPVPSNYRPKWASFMSNSGNLAV